eukprot:8477000-Pyramimonas_sp.AAC.1
MKGKATINAPRGDGAIECSPVPTIEDWRAIGIADSIAELRIQRSTWFQKRFGHPLHHQLCVAAAF